MDSLDFNLRQLILSDLAKTVDPSRTDESTNQAVDVISSRVVTRDVKAAESHEFSIERVEMSASRVECNIAFGELAVNVLSTRVAETVGVLDEILRDVPSIAFARSLAWNEWALPDQLVYTTVSSLLWLASSHPTYYSRATESILKFAKAAVSHLRSAPAEHVITEVAPAFHGLYRAITSTPFGWLFPEWQKISAITKELFESDVVDRLNSLLSEYLRDATDNEHQETMFIRTLLSRYLSNGRPLSGYFAVCSVMEIQWTVLGQVLSPPIIPSSVASTSAGRRHHITEAQAANGSWNTLMNNSIPKDAAPFPFAPEVVSSLSSSLSSATQCFTDLLEQVENLRTLEPEIYGYETLAESLKLATLCSVALGELDQTLFDRIKIVLSDAAPVNDALLQDAAIKSVNVLVQNFSYIAPTMASHMRRFVTSPIPTFEVEFDTVARVPPPLNAASRCLARCIKLAPDDDLGMSYMYSLFNFVPGGVADGFSPGKGGLSRTHGHDIVDGALPSYSEEDRRLIGVSTTYVITHLALDLENEEIAQLAISMLLQRLRHSEPSVEAAIAYNLVDLALPAPTEMFSDIIKAFSQITGASLQSETSTARHNAILAAQTRLAQELRGRTGNQTTYLIELLTLFNDLGTAIQTKAHENRPNSEYIEHLSALVLPIDSLLGHYEISAPDQNSDLVGLFQGFWFITALFRLCDSKFAGSNEWKIAAFARVAARTPAFVLEESHDYLSSDLEYNRALRKDYSEHVAAELRSILTKLVGARVSEIRQLTPAQLVFLLAMHDIETLRIALGLPSALPNYFVNGSVNSTAPLVTSMESLAESVIRSCVEALGSKIVDHSLGKDITIELQKLLVSSCHRISKARDIASKYLDRLVSAFPSLMCDSAFVFAILDVLTLLQHSCDGKQLDEYNPQHLFHLERSGLTLSLTDSYTTRREILALLHKNAKKWLSRSVSRAPLEVQAILQKYLSDHRRIPLPYATELGSSLALQCATEFGVLQSRRVPSSPLDSVKLDRAKVFTSQLSSHAYFTGEAAGVRLANRRGSDEVQKLPPAHAPQNEIQALKQKMTQAVHEIHQKTSVLTAQDLRRLLFRCASVLISLSQPDHELLHYLVVVPFESLTPASISSGTEAWNWLVRERPDLEIGLMLEINAAWLSTIEQKKGMFSSAVDSHDPFFSPVEYSPTDKDSIDRSIQTARRLLEPHTILLQTLASRFQAVRYQHASLMRLLLRLILRSARAHHLMSTHPLAREARFTLLLFGFQALRNSRMDTTSEIRLRAALYAAAFSWFAVRPQWTFGANRVQLDVDVKLLHEFLDALQGDSLRADHDITSFDSARHLEGYGSKVREQSVLLRALVENEISRLLVWANPSNETSLGSDRPAWDPLITPDAWVHLVQTAWKVNPAVGVQMAERFKIPSVIAEVGRLIKMRPGTVIDTPEALKFFLGDRVDVSLQAQSKHILLWAAVPPVVAVTYFQPRFKNDPSILQYAHRVLEGHPVDVTFFFVPQVVQALRSDALGYVERFIFETAKISQLFCHQIIWNMKANTYKDDAAEEPDEMKPMLDRMTDMVVASLSGPAREFYDREFTFFEEVTSISGKLKPYIKKSKPEKKAKIDEEMAKIQVDVGVYLPSNPDGTVVDIDKRSGRPLQSHAKAPFMATFKVRKEHIVTQDTPPDDEDSVIRQPEAKSHYDVWQQAIFKVGDDCRQDVLALQIIAMFKNIFTRVGLTLYLYPYRVTATAPGCGVIDVVPNATSRDEMGRAKINDLLGFFEAKYGHTESVAFQQARLNFIQSMAAYSVACYILQIKDRHNGNIMIDGEGHIVHIDFGFLFDIDE